MVSRPFRQFDVFKNADKETAGVHPYLIVLQSDVITALDTCIVAPLVSPKIIKYFERLLPIVTVNNRDYAIAIPDMAAIPSTTIGNPVANLESERYRIVAAVDLVFTGI